MGIWFLTNAFANVLAGLLSTLYPDPSQPPAYIFGIPIDNFTAFFMVFVILSLIAAIALFLMRGKLETMMHGIE